MAPRIYGRAPCKHCGERITTNARGRAIHERSAACQRVVLIRAADVVLAALDVGGEQSRAFAEEIATLRNALAYARQRNTQGRVGR